jgi:outer membrane protein assembly factor BamB
MQAYTPTQNNLWINTDVTNVQSTFTPLVGSDGTIYAVSSLASHILVAVNNVTGATIYKIPINSNQIALGPGGIIYVGGNNLAAYDSGGNRKWEISFVGDVGTPAVDDGGIIYVGSNGYVSAVNPNGTILWQHANSGIIFGSAAIGLDGSIYIPGSNGKLYAFTGNSTPPPPPPPPPPPSTTPIWPMIRYNPQGTGQSPYTGPQTLPSRFKWVFQATDSINSTPAVDNSGTLYFGSNDSYVYAVNPPTDGSGLGKLKWYYNAAVSIGTSSPAISPDSSTIYIGTSNKRLLALTASTGALSWFYDTSGNTQVSSPIIDPNGTIYIVVSNTLYGLNSAGSLVWYYKAATSLTINFPPAIGTNGHVYITLNDATIDNTNRPNVVALIPNTGGRQGTVKWASVTGFNQFSQIVYPPVIASDGTIYVVTQRDNISYGGGSLIGLSHITGAVEFTIGFTLSPNNRFNYIIGRPIITSDGLLYFTLVDTASVTQTLFYTSYEIKQDGSYSTVVNNDIRYANSIIGKDKKIYSAIGTIVSAVSNQSLLWKYTLAFAATSEPVLGSDGTLYVGANKIMYAF